MGKNDEKYLHRRRNSRDCFHSLDRPRGHLLQKPRLQGHDVDHFLQDMSWKPLKGRGLEGKLKEQLYRKLQPLSGGPLTVLALVPRPGTSKAVSGHKIHPYLLRGVSITDAQSRLGGRHHLHSDGAGVPVSGGDHRLSHPGGAGVALVEHDGYGLLHRCARRGDGAARPA